MSSVLAPTFNQATPGSPPTPPSEVQVAAPRALPTPNQRQRYSVWTITPPPPAEARGPALPPLAPLPLHLNTISCIASHARHAAGPALRPHVFPLFVGEVNGRAQSFFFSEAEHQGSSSAECTESLFRRSIVFPDPSVQRSRSNIQPSNARKPSNSSV